MEKGALQCSLLFTDISTLISCCGQLLWGLSSIVCSNRVWPRSLRRTRDIRHESLHLKMPRRFVALASMERSCFSKNREMQQMMILRYAGLRHLSFVLSVLLMSVKRG